MIAFSVPTRSETRKSTDGGRTLRERVGEREREREREREVKMCVG